MTLAIVFFVVNVFITLLSMATVFLTCVFMLIIDKWSNGKCQLFLGTTYSISMVLWIPHGRETFIEQQISSYIFHVALLTVIYCVTKRDVDMHVKAYRLQKLHDRVYAELLRGGG